MKRLLSMCMVCLLGVVMFSSCDLFQRDSSEKQITSFVITSPNAVGVINESLKTITVDLPEGTDVTNLVPSIVVSDYAIVSPASGVAQNFTNPVAYTVTAQDGSSVNYVVTVTIDGQGGPGGGDPTTISGSINANTTWKDLGLPIDYIVEGQLAIDGNALLTIEPGVTIMFTGVDGGMRVGENAGLRMVGTVEKPICFVGPANNPNNGSWGNVVLTSKRNDNVWEYVEFVRGGTNEYEWASVVDIEGGKVSMKHCTIDGSLGCGLDIEYDGKFLAFEDNIIKNCAAYPMALEETDHLFGLNGNNTFTNNGKNYIYVSGRSVDVEAHTTLVKMSVPYYFQDGLSLEAPYKFTIEAGTILLFNADKDFHISENSTLIAEGTAAEPIIFRGREDEAGYWFGVRYHSTKEASCMRFCQISGGGNDGDGFHAANLSIWDGSRLTMTDCSFSKSIHYGIALDEITNLTGMPHSNITFSTCTSGNVFVETGGTYKGVEYTDEQVLDNLP